MTKFFVVIGLPGSGKSHLVRDLHKKYCAFAVEDYMKDSIKGLPQLTKSQHHNKLMCSLREGRNCVIADIEFCKRCRRDELERIVQDVVPGIKIKWRYFENDPEKCIKNVKHRNSPNAQEEIEKIGCLSKQYYIPPNVKPIPIVVDDA